MKQNHNRSPRHKYANKFTSPWLFHLKWAKHRTVRCVRYGKIKNSICAKYYQLTTNIYFLRNNNFLLNCHWHYTFNYTKNHADALLGTCHNNGCSIIRSFIHFADWRCLFRKWCSEVATNYMVYVVDITFRVYICCKVRPKKPTTTPGPYFRTGMLVKIMHNLVRASENRFHLVLLPSINFQCCNFLCGSWRVWFGQDWEVSRYTSFGQVGIFTKVRLCYTYKNVQHL